MQDQNKRKIKNNLCLNVTKGTIFKPTLYNPLRNNYAKFA